MKCISATRFRRDRKGWLMQDQASVMARYKQLREAGKRVAEQLTKLLSKDIMHEGGEKLGILQGETLVLHSEEEMFVLMDFCIHDVRRQGRNAVDRLLAEALYHPGSDEAILPRPRSTPWLSGLLGEP